MKRVFLLIVSITAIFFSVFGCTQKDNINVQSNDGKTTVTAAIFISHVFVHVAVKDRVRSLGAL